MFVKQRILNSLDCLYESLRTTLLLLKNKCNLLTPPIIDSDSCLILGNGPSLEATYKEFPSLFNNQPCFCVNDAAKTRLFTVIKPQYYLIYDPCYWDINASIKIRSTSLTLLETIGTQVSWQMVLFIPNRAKRYIASFKLCLNPNISINFFPDHCVGGVNFLKNIAYRRGIGFPKAFNVLTIALFIGVMLGFKKLALVGADHSWHEQMAVTDLNLLCVKQKHFYDLDKETPTIPIYKDAAETVPYRIFELFKRWSDVFYCYDEITRFARLNGTAIYNSSKTSYIDSFPRLPLDKILHA